MIYDETVRVKPGELNIVLEVLGSTKWKRKMQIGKEEIKLQSHTFYTQNLKSSAKNNRTWK